MASFLVAVKMRGMEQSVNNRFIGIRKSTKGEKIDGYFQGSMYGAYNANER